MESHRLAKIVNDQFDEWLLDVEPKLTKHEFELRSTKRWALSKIVEILRESDRPVEDLDMFSKMMWQYSQVDPKTMRIFSIAHHLAENVLEFVIITIA